MDASDIAGQFILCVDCSEGGKQCKASLKDVSFRGKACHSTTDTKQLHHQIQIMLR